MCRPSSLPARAVKSARCGDRGGSVLVHEKPLKGSSAGTRCWTALSRRETRGSSRCCSGSSRIGTPGRLVGHRSRSGMMRIVEMAAPSSASVLITGETGSGKENRGADAATSFRRGPMDHLWRFNCSAIPETLMESEILATSAAPSRARPEAHRLLRACGCRNVAAG